LEYAYDDWCIYRLAKELKRPKKEINLFAKRAMNYKINKSLRIVEDRPGIMPAVSFRKGISPFQW